MLVYLAFSLTLAGAAFVYLGSPHQQWRGTSLRPTVWGPASALLLVAGLTSWIHATLPLTGVFVFLVQLMLLWTCFPFIGVYMRRRS